MQGFIDQSKDSQGDKMRWRLVLIGLTLPTTVFGGYLWHLYHVLDQSFTLQEEFIPTRIYSDITRVALAHPRTEIEARLKSLGYTPTRSGNLLQFTLHPMDYPNYLIRERHPQIDAPDKNVRLKFDADKPDSALQTIHIGEIECEDLFLEPELVATWSRGAKEIREVIKFADMPSQVWKAIIAVEDQHFLDHKGFDPRGFARAVWVNLKSLRFAQGGSTLTQQLVKNLTGHKQRNLLRKLNELLLALLLEVKYDKEQILERYLNEVNLGQVGNMEVHGVAEGAKYFFGKPVSELNLGETALMAGLIRGPDYYSPYRHKERAVERQKVVLKKMYETGQIAEGEMEEAFKQPIRLAPPTVAGSKAPYFTDFAKAELAKLLKDKVVEAELMSAGLRVYTTLDVSMNIAAQRIVATKIDEMEKRLKLPGGIRLEGALAAVDQSTGYIRALIGGRNYGQSTFNRILNMKRQVGSTFKPVVYLTAFLKGESPEGKPYAPGTPAEDAPFKLIYDQGRQNWQPKNYEKTFMSWIPYRTALAHSVNTVAARLGMEIGLEPIIQTGRSLGIDSDLPTVPSLTLGVAELSPIELLRAYGTIANHGARDSLTVIRAVTHDNGSDFFRVVYHPTQVVDAGAADLLTDTLQNVFTEGTARAAPAFGFDRPAAGKTGTTSNHRDAWFAGYTPQLTAVVWVGMDQDTEAAKEVAKLNLTGANSALPIWATFMHDALVGEPPALFSVSSGVATAKIDVHTGKPASPSCPDAQTVTEKFVAGREPKTQSCLPTWPESAKEMNVK